MATLNVRFIADDKVRVIDTTEIKTVMDLKSHIEKQHGIPSDDQIFVRQNEILYDVILLEFLGLLPGELQLYKKISPGKSIAVEVSPELVEGKRLPDLVLGITSDMSVSDLKLMIVKELGVRPHCQNLMCMGVKMKNSLLLREYIVEKPPKFFLKVAKEDLNDYEDDDEDDSHSTSTNNGWFVD
ncbi:hypothetical protein FRX31_033703 [Thalictrum thalictroides]|uniref:Ubiquitin-like domain-containing protein n=1 Tax=Thalictrum thalictroides TaxID=46969 RepID=A0A7J6UVS0_THATH|nr:hypothetical protein FRX31_033703 [Thalictrum thalictroides]